MSDGWRIRLGSSLELSFDQFRKKIFSSDINLIRANLYI